MTTMTPLDAALDLLLRLPPQQAARNLRAICRLQPALQSDLESATDQPLRTARDPCCGGGDGGAGREYVLCEYNRGGGDENNFRSPYCNKYHPRLAATDDDYKPSTALRQLEIACNDAFDKYRDMYYEGGVSSVYLWSLENGATAAAILLKKRGNNNNSRSAKIQGSWDSLHVVEMIERRGKWRYKMTSSVMLWLQTNKQVSSGLMNIGGSISRQTTRDVRVGKTFSHVINLGELVEETEAQMRMHLNEIYFWKTKDVVTRHLRCASTVHAQQQRRRNSRMLDASKAVIRRTPSGKHLLVPAGDSVHV